MREKERMVHLLEVLGPVKKLVKCYSRSAADSNVAIPYLLRPYNVLKATVGYLLLEVTKRSDVSTCVVYDFINDRLRAVRQDMTIQRLPPEQCINLLEPMIRFYVYYGYKLCEHPIHDFDPVLNKKYLLECIKWFLSCYDSVQASENNDNMNEITNCLGGMDLQNANGISPICDRVLVESLYILCNLDDVHPLLRYLNLPKDIKSIPIVQLSYKIAIAHLKGNFIRLCRLMERLCPLTYCAFFIYLPVIQRQSLRVLSVGYNSKQLSLPTDTVSRWLWLPPAAARELCAHYGLKAGEDSVHFLKSNFNCDVAVHQPIKHLLHDKKLNLSVEHIFTYSTNE
ncbi:SAC3 domain-containing protein 1 isoform X2 [Plodia interpunctella]|uniref:SAC3 domain-containing protein 1 isoform X2 n=1 Tax=Plodia interpunctella TaxID=58824 RepID=UPI002367F572|nr:SAC3 domain-containing protein 1 isoform X2 [Plodia interpunctella]